MHPVSYIAPGDQLQAKDIQLLQSRFEQLSGSSQVPCETLLYFTKPPKFQLSSHGMVCVYSGVKNVSSLQKAVAVSRGENLIFTAPENIITDGNGLMLDRASKLSDFFMAAPLKHTGIAYRLGIRHFTNVGYFITRKDFAVRYSKLLDDPSQLVLLADKSLALIPLDPDLELPKFLIRQLNAVRPYWPIAKHLVSIQFEKVQKSLEERKKRRLLKQIKPIKYSVDMLVFIICRDRVEPLKKLIAWCEDEGLKNIYLIDNDSTYPPLLEYYEHTKYEVVRLTANMGHTAPWDAGIVGVYARDKPYILTDPDIIPLPEAHGAVKLFCELLTRYPERVKVGFGLKIDDLPDSYSLKKHVISWESRYWKRQVEAEVYDAEIDTTFAVYRPNMHYTIGPSLRTGGKYVARHEPWYINSANPGKEILYYRKNANTSVGSWGIETNDLTDTYINNFNKQHTSF